MNVTLNIENDAELRRAYIKDCIKGQVLAIVREEFTAMVKEEIERKIKGSDVGNFERIQKEATFTNTCFSKLIGQEIFRKSKITKTYNKIKVKDIEFRLHPRLNTIYLVIVSENNIEYDFNDTDFGVNNDF